MLSSLNPIPFKLVTLILLLVSLNALLNNPVGPPKLKSSPVASFINAPLARGASMSMTLRLCGARAARRAALTPTGPAPITARSYDLSEIDPGETAACSTVVDDVDVDVDVDELRRWWWSLDGFGVS